MYNHHKVYSCCVYSCSIYHTSLNRGRGFYFFFVGFLTRPLNETGLYSGEASNCRKRRGPISTIRVVTPRSYSFRVHAILPRSSLYSSTRPLFTKRLNLSRPLNGAGLYSEEAFIRGNTVGTPLPLHRNYITSLNAL